MSKYLGIDGKVYEFHDGDYADFDGQPATPPPEPVLRMQRLLEALERHFVTWPASMDELNRQRIANLKGETISENYEG